MNATCDKIHKYMIHTVLVTLVFVAFLSLECIISKNPFISSKLYCKFLYQERKKEICYMAKNAIFQYLIRLSVWLTV